MKTWAIGFDLPRALTVFSWASGSKSGKNLRWAFSVLYIVAIVATRIARRTRPYGGEDAPFAAK
jgi:hypothetical protein